MEAQLREIDRLATAMTEPFVVATPDDDTDPVWRAIVAMEDAESRGLIPPLPRRGPPPRPVSQKAARLAARIHRDGLSWPAVARYIRMAGLGTHDSQALARAAEEAINGRPE
jgi:hypothetical protein